MGSRPRTGRIVVAQTSRDWLRRAMFWTGIGFSGLLVLLVGFVCYSVAGIDVKVDGEYHPKQVTKVMSADGELIGEIFEERRTVVPPGQIPKVMLQAIVDAED